MTGVGKVQGVVADCRRCHLSEACDPVVMDGGDTARYLVVGESPSRKDEELGGAFRDATGRLMRDVVRKTGIHSRHVAYTNAVHCVGGKKGPGPGEIEACRVNLLLEMAVVRPKVMLLCGAGALGVFRGDLSVTHHRGVPFMVGGVVAIPTFHPAFVMKMNKFEKALWSDVAQAKRRVEVGRWVDWPEMCVWCGDDVEVYDPDGIALCVEHRKYENAGRVHGQPMLV